jgi:hypothetical protein
MNQIAFPDVRELGPGKKMYGKAWVRLSESGVIPGLSIQIQYKVNGIMNGFAIVQVRPGMLKFMNEECRLEVFYPITKGWPVGVYVA